MTPPSTQNLKALGLRILFLICCSTFSFLPNVGLRLTWISNNLSLKCESLLYHIDTLPLERKHSQPEYITHDPSLILPFTHLYGTHLPEITIRKTFDTGSNCTRPSRKPIALIPLVGRIQGGNTGEISNNEN